MGGDFFEGIAHWAEDEIHHIFNVCNGKTVRQGMMVSLFIPQENINSSVFKPCFDFVDHNHLL